MKKEIRAFVIISLIILILLFFNDKYNKSLEKANVQKEYSENEVIDNNTIEDSNPVKETNNQEEKNNSTKPNDKKEEPFTSVDESSDKKEEPSTSVEEPSVEEIKDDLVEVKDIILDKNEITLYTNETIKINPSIYPSNASNKSLTFKSSDESIIKVDNNGNVTGITTGTYNTKGYTSAKIIVTSSNNISKSVNVKLYSRERIHFISHGESSGTNHITGDAILLESNGHYAMIDAGNTEVSKKIVDYLKKNNVEKLDFLLFTHMDSDHAGNFQEILSSGIKVTNVWIKNYEISPYIDGYKPNNDSNGYDKGLGSQSSTANKALARYRRIIYLANYSKYSDMVTNIKDISGSSEGTLYNYKYLNFKLTLYNNKSNVKAYSNENYNSVVALYEINNHKVLLTGDIYGTNDLNLISTKVGLVDILKLPHHGSRACALLDRDTTSTSLSSLKPKYIVVTSSKKKLSNIKKEYNVADGDLCVDKVSNYSSDKVFYVDETNDALIIDLSGNLIKFNKN